MSRSCVHAFRVAVEAEVDHHHEGMFPSSDTIRRLSTLFPLALYYISDIYTANEETQRCHPVIILPSISSLEQTL